MSRPIPLASLLGHMLEMAMFGAQSCIDCGEEDCAGQCRQERPTARPPASVDKSKRRPASDTIPDIVDDDGEQDDEALQVEDETDPEDIMPK